MIRMPSGFSSRSKAVVGFLRHDDQDVGPRYVWIKHRRVGKNELRAAGSAARFRAEVLRHGGEAVFDKLQPALPMQMADRMTPWPPNPAIRISVSCMTHSISGSST